MTKWSVNRCWNSMYTSRPIRYIELAATVYVNNDVINTLTPWRQKWCLSRVRYNVKPQDHLCAPRKNNTLQIICMIMYRKFSSRNYTATNGIFNFYMHSLLINFTKRCIDWQHITVYSISLQQHMLTSSWNRKNEVRYGNGVVKTNLFVFVKCHDTLSVFFSCKTSQVAPLRVM